MKVVATAPMPGSKMPSLPCAGLTSTPFLRAMGRNMLLRPLGFKCEDVAVNGIQHPRQVHANPTPGRRDLGHASWQLVEQRAQRRRIVRHDAVGAELEETRGLAGVVDRPEVD